MESADERHLNALIEASRNGDPAWVADVWRRLAPHEQEAVLFRLLEMPTGATLETVEPHWPTEVVDTAMAPAEQTELIPKLVEERAAMTPAEQTESIPKLVEDLQGLSASHGDDQALLPDQLAVRNEYWSRWLRRWKISALVTGWAVTTVFAFTAETSTFGPMEWVVAMFGTVVLGGTLIGTLVNFAVAAIAPRTHAPTG